MTTCLTLPLWMYASRPSRSLSVLVEPMASMFEQNVAMPIAVQLGERAGEAKLERHIEAGQSAHPADDRARTRRTL